MPARILMMLVISSVPFLGWSYETHQDLAYVSRNQNVHIFEPFFSFDQLSAIFGHGSMEHFNQGKDHNREKK